MFGPTKPIAFPTPTSVTAQQLQTLKTASGQPRQGSQSPNPFVRGGSPTFPQHVSGVTAILKKSSDVSTKATITFQRSAADGLYVDSSVYVSGYQGNPQPVKVASGQSPISFPLNNTGESLAFTVQANGPTGSAPLSSAPTTTSKLVSTPLATTPTTSGTGVGVTPYTSPAHQWINAATGTGYTSTQPAFSDLAGKYSNIVLAESQAGADWGAKVNAALAVLGATAGEVWISQAAGVSAIAADITLSAGHVLRFTQAGGYSLGTHRIVVSGGASDSAVIGSPSGTLLTYTGSGSAILVGTTSADTLRFTIQNIQVQLSGATSTALGMSFFRSWWPVVRDCMVLSNNLGSVVNGQTAMLFDGTGGQTVYANLQNPIIAGSFTNGIVFQNLGGLNSTIVGGSLNCETVTVQSGSTALSYDSTCGANRILSTDMEGWGTGLYCNGEANLFNARTEDCTVNVNFDSSSRGNMFEGTALATPTDTGVFNQWILSPATGQAIGSKIQALTVGGPGGSSAAPFSFTGGVNIFEDGLGNTLSQRNSTTSQTYRIYTSVASSNFQFLGLTGNYAGGEPGIFVSGSGSFTTSDLWMSALGTGLVKCVSSFRALATAAASATANVNSPIISFLGNYVSATATITSTTVTSNVLTVSATNTFSAGDTVTLTGLTTSTFLNNQTLTVIATGLSGSQFEAALTHANYGATADTGTAAKNANDVWAWQNILGTGTNPTSTLALTHTGSSGAVNLALPALTTGIGNGLSAQPVTTTLLGTGTGPTTPSTIVNYLKISIAGTVYYLPLFQ